MGKLKVFELWKGLGLDMWKVVVGKKKSFARGGSEILLLSSGVLRPARTD
jgi:hypothetical protein